MVQGTQTRPSTAEDFHRLADLAHERGLRVFESAPHTWWCTSHSSPLRLHVVTGYTCDCPGFFHHGRCTHHAALLAHLGWLPEVEDEAPISACPACTAGKIEEFGVSGPIGCKPCPVCDGTGVVPAPATRPYGLPAVQPVAAAA